MKTKIITKAMYNEAKAIIKEYEKLMPKYDEKFKDVTMQTELTNIPFSKRAKGVLMAEDFYIDETVSRLCEHIDFLCERKYRSFGDNTKKELRCVVHFAQINNNQ